jgi:tetratricopeptide (TPR) repeat protein
MLKAAKDEFGRVLDKEPNNTVALAYLAQLNYSEAGSIQDMDKKVAKLDESRAWYEKLSQVDPKNKEALYSLGVIAWAKWYPAIGAARSKLGMRPEDPGPLKDKKVRDELRSKFWPVVEDGINNLQKALDVDKNYDEAMAYLNLLYRERADLAESPDEYRKDIGSADNWLQRALDTRKAKASATLNASGMGGSEPAR